MNIPKTEKNKEVIATPVEVIKNRIFDMPTTNTNRHQRVSFHNS